MTGRSGVRAAQWAALLVGALALAVTLAEIPLAGLARQSVLASGGSLPFPFTLAYGVVGLLLAWRKPGNLIGWLMLAAAAVAAALFSPLRRWVQRVVDRRFNRARYDADRTVAAFAASLQDAVDLDVVRTDLAATVRVALEPAQLSVWIRGGAG